MIQRGFSRADRAVSAEVRGTSGPTERRGKKKVTRNHEDEGREKEGNDEWCYTFAGMCNGTRHIV